MPAFRPCWGMVIALLLAGLPGRVPAGDLQTDLSAHILLAEIGESWGAATDLAVAARFAPAPQLALGLEGAAMLPLPTSGEVQKTDLTLRVNPAAWLLFGEPEMWSYLKLGCGPDFHLREDSLEPVLSLVAAAGFAVAPRELKIHFGFEITGELDILGQVTTRTIGLGGFLGWSY